MSAVSPTPNPRQRIHDWRELLEKIEEMRRKRISIEAACAHIGIAYSTYYAWVRRQKKEKQNED